MEEGGEGCCSCCWKVVGSGGGGVPTARGSSVYLNTSSPICDSSKTLFGTPLFVPFGFPCLFSGGEAFLNVDMALFILFCFLLKTTIRTHTTRMTTTSPTTTATDTMIMKRNVLSSLVSSGKTAINTVY